MRALIDSIGRVEYAAGHTIGRLLELPQDNNMVEHNVPKTDGFVVE